MGQAANDDPNFDNKFRMEKGEKHTAWDSGSTSCNLNLWWIENQLSKNVDPIIMSFFQVRARACECV